MNTAGIKIRIILVVFLALFVVAPLSWAATYYVDATNGKDSNTGLSPSTPWKTVAKVNASKFNPGDQILFKGGRFREGNLSFLLQDKKANRLSVSLIHLSNPDNLFSFLRVDTEQRVYPPEGLGLATPNGSRNNTRGRFEECPMSMGCCSNP